MKAIRILAAAALLAPLAAAAQAYYAQARPLHDPALTRSELRECMYRDEALGATAIRSSWSAARFGRDAAGGYAGERLENAETG